MVYRRITGRLESGHTLTGIGGSNPSLSAIIGSHRLPRSPHRQQEPALLRMKLHRKRDKWLRRLTLPSGQNGPSACPGGLSQRERYRGRCRGGRIRPPRRAQRGAPSPWSETFSLRQSTRNYVSLQPPPVGQSVRDRDRLPLCARIPDGRSHWIGCRISSRSQPAPGVPQARWSRIQFW